MIETLRQGRMRLRLALAAVLLLAQLGAMAHVLDHADEGLADRCFSCVTAKHFDHLAAAPVADAASVVVPAATCHADLVPIAPVCAGARPRQRAPPEPFFSI